MDQGESRMLTKKVFSGMGLYKSDNNIGYFFPGAYMSGTCFKT